jgi:hypothetical protein
VIFLLGTIMGVFNHYSHLRWITRGRDAFLFHQMQYQNRRFTRFELHHNLIHDVISTVGGLVLICVVYELLVAGFTAILPPSRASREV